MKTLKKNSHNSIMRKQITRFTNMGKRLEQTLDSKDIWVENKHIGRLLALLVIREM